MKTKIILCLLPLFLAVSLSAQQLKKSRLYYPDGSVQAVYQHPKGEPEWRQGFYREYDVSGEFVLQGLYNDNKMTGTWSHYRRKRLHKTVQYLDGKMNGITITYWRNGMVRSQQHYEQGVKSGTYCYYKDEQIIEKGHYKEGLKSGSWSYYLDGVMSCEGHFKEDQKHGEWTIYRENLKNESVPEASVNYVSGSIEGTITVYDDNGVGREMPRPSEPLPDADKMPTFPGGEEAMMKFIYKDIRYPTYARESGIEGIVVVSFELDELGFPSGFLLERSLADEGETDHSCGDEALRLISQMPRWNPAYFEGVPIRIKYNLPIRFALR